MIYYLVVWTLFASGSIPRIDVYETKREACVELMSLQGHAVLMAKFDGDKILWTKPVTCAPYKP